jgi:phosphatidate cytidylyltransferase
MNRVIPGICLAAGWLLLLFLGPAPLFWGIVVAGTCVALHEFFRMVMKQLRGLRLLATIAVCLLPVLATIFPQSDILLAGTIASLLGLLFLSLQAYGRLDDVLKYGCYSVFASLYVSLCVAHLVLIRFAPQGEFWLTMLMLIVAGSDTGAYYAGRAFGHRKIFPLISPKKTLAGCVGGMFAGVIAAEAFNLLLPQPVNPFILLLAASSLVLIGIAGDLAESMIKRSVGVKDSGTILLGHGGILDRVDSLLLTAPVLYYLLHFGILQ